MKGRGLPCVSWQQPQHRGRASIERSSGAHARHLFSHASSGTIIQDSPLSYKQFMAQKYPWLHHFTTTQVCYEHLTYLIREQGKYTNPANCCWMLPLVSVLSTLLIHPQGDTASHRGDERGEPPRPPRPLCQPFWCVSPPNPGGIGLRCHGSRWTQPARAGSAGFGCQKGSSALCRFCALPPAWH
jgi:hypothetical protein